MQCSYCDQPATMRIPAVPEQVCGAHGGEFWTGLLAFAITRPKEDTQLTAASQRVIAAEVAAATAVAEPISVLRPAVWDGDRMEVVAAA
jgi:hypothetical protein